MDILALISAIIGVVILSFVVSFGNKIDNRWVRYVIAIVGIFIAIGFVGYLPALIGDGDASTSAKAGQYFAYLIVGAVVLKYLFFRNPSK